MLVLERHVLLHGTPSHSASVFAASNLKFQAATSSYSVNYRPLPSLYWATATFGLGDDNLQRPNARRRPRDLQFVLSATQQADGIEDPENRAPLVESDSTEHGNGNDNANGDCAQRLTSQDGQAGTRSSSLSPVSSEYPSPPLDVLYRDQHIAAVCKPPLMHVHRPDFGSKDKEFVLQKARNELGARVYFPHRLDRGTSGCLLMGFSPEASKALHRALSDERSRKTYVAIVRGSGEAYIGRGWFTVDRPIKDDKKVLREASTRFLFVAGGEEPGPRCCLVLAQPLSGRFHQIRRHLNGLSHPVVGDSVHGNSRFNRGIAQEHGAPVGRLLLHCLRIELPTLPQPGTERWYRQEEYADKFDAQGDDHPFHDAGEDQSPTGGGRPRGTRERVQESGAFWTAESRRSKRIPVRSQRGVDNSSDGDCGASSDCAGIAGPGDGQAVELSPDDANAGFASSRWKCGLRGGESDLASAAAAGPRARSLEQRVIANTRSDSGFLVRDVDDDEVGVGSGSHRTANASSLDVVQVDGVSGWKGLRVWCPPPDDFMEFLRGVPWWEEGLIEAAGRGR